MLLSRQQHGVGSRPQQQRRWAVAPSGARPQQQQQQQLRRPVLARASGKQPPRLREDSKSRQREQERELQALEALPVKEAKIETLALWVAAACAFGGGVWYTQGAEKAEEFFAGYLLEQSLSIDNLFVFILVFNFFQTPVSSQGKVLSFGIATAAVLRLVMILLGVELIEKFEPVLLLFALILLFSSYKLLFADDSDEDESLEDNAIVRFCRKVITVSSSYDGDNFFTVQNGVKVATPLLLVLAVIELSDVVFAVDSIPAVFGVTLDPFIVYTSNMFAILSLRALYGFVSTAMSELRYLDKAVAMVLGFIGAKMVAEFGDIHVPTDVSLLVVGLLLGGGVGASLLLPEPRDGAE
jgi:TerC family integral membrane protein